MGPKQLLCCQQSKRARDCKSRNINIVSDNENLCIATSARQRRPSDVLHKHPRSCIYNGGWVRDTGQAGPSAGSQIWAGCQGCAGCTEAGSGSSPSSAHPTLSEIRRMSSDPQNYANKTFSDKPGKAEAFIPMTRPPAPALLWAPSPAHNTGRVLLSQNSEQGSASSRCPESAEQQRQEEEDTMAAEN